MAGVQALIPIMANMCFHHFSQSPNFLCLSYHLEKYYLLVWIYGPPSSQLGLLHSQNILKESIGIQKESKRDEREQGQRETIYSLSDVFSFLFASSADHFIITPAYCTI